MSGKRCPALAPAVSALVVIALLSVVVGCGTTQPADGSAHLNRVSGTALHLGDYRVATTHTRAAKTWTTYEPTTAGLTASEVDVEALTSAYWQSLPSIDEVVTAHGSPPQVMFADVQNGSHLTFAYGNLGLYFGPHSDRVIELRFGDESVFRLNGVGVGSTLDEVIAAYGNPVRTVNGENGWEDEVLYLPDGEAGYLQYNRLGVRFFLHRESPTVTAMYLFEPGYYSSEP